MSDLSTLEEHVVLLAPYFSRWRGVYQLPPTEIFIALAGQRVDTDALTVPRVKLFTPQCPLDRNDKPWLQRFETIDRKFKAKIESLSVPFPIRGVRIVPLRRYEWAFAHLERTRQELSAVVQEFIEDFSSILSQIEAHVPAAIWQYVAGKLPQRSTLARKFAVGMIPIRLVGTSATVVSETDILQHQDIVRDAVRETVHTAVEAMIAGPREELADALVNLNDLIERGGRVTERTFDSIRRAIDKIRAFEFVANDDLLRQIREMEQRLANTPPRDVVHNAAVAAEMQRALRRLVAEAQDENRAAEDAARFLGTRRTVMLSSHQRPVTVPTPELISAEAG